MSAEQTERTIHIDALLLLLVILIALKAFGAIGLSWFWVLAPLWMPFALVAIVIILAILFVAIGAIVLR